jgi:hypothetical protein
MVIYQLAYGLSRHGAESRRATAALQNAAELATALK